MRKPSACSASIASAVVGLIGSATPTSAGERAVDREQVHDRLALATQARRRAPRRIRPTCRRRSHHGRVAEHDAAAVDRRLECPCPAPPRKSSTRRQRRAAARVRPRRSPRRADARSTARAPPRAAARRLRRSRRTHDHRRRASARPSVSVPVLSTTSVSTRSRRSSASAFLTSTPAVAPRPVPTMMAIGVARPSAHGHAMISTATALTSASARRGGGPHSAPRRRRPASRRSTTAGTKYDARRDRPAAGSARGCAAPRRPSGRSAPAACRAPTRSARTSSVPVVLMVPPVTRAPGSFSDRDRLAGHHRFVDGAAPVDDDAVDRHASRPAGRGRRRRPAPRASGTSRSPPSRDDARGLRREAEELPDGGAGPAPRAQFQHLSEQHERRDDDGRVEVGLDDAVHPKPSGKAPGAIVATAL